MKANTKETIYLVAAVAGIVAAYYTIKQAKQGIEATKEGLDITSPDNWFYSGVNKIGSSITGEQSWSLGTAIYEVFNDDPVLKQLEKDRSYNWLEGYKGSEWVGI